MIKNNNDNDNYIKHNNNNEFFGITLIMFFIKKYCNNKI